MHSVRSLIDADTADARNSLLFTSRIVALIYGLVWFWWALFQVPDLVDMLPSVICTLGYLLTASRYKASTVLQHGVIVLSLLAALDVSIISHPSHFVVALLAMPIILGGFLLGPAISTLVTLANWGILFWLWPDSPIELTSTYAVFSLSLSVVIQAIVWVAVHALQDALERYANGWQEARATLLQVQDRRSEIYRALHSLEEGMVRIERMNNELILAQQQAEAAGEIKTRFVNTVSHELRAPLNLIMGFSRLMVVSPESYGEPLPREYRSDVDVIYRNAQHLTELIDDILDLGKIEAKHLPLVKDMVDLKHDVIEPAAEITEPLALRKGLKFEIKDEGNLPALFVDKVRLRQVLINLLMNAIRCTNEGGIVITLRQQDGSVVVAVRDTGTGISEKDIPNLFKEFVQVGQGKAEGSTGLGLPIAKHLVELHGGRVRAESRLGEGTTFFVELDAPDAEHASQILITDRLARGTRHRSVLVLQEDPGVMRLLGRHLEGYHLVGLPRVEGLGNQIDLLRPRAVLTESATEQAAKTAIRDLGARVPLITCDWPISSLYRSSPNLVSYMIKPVSPDVVRDAMHSLFPEPKNQINIVLTDDDPAAVRLLERILTALPHAYAIRKAYNGTQALQLLREGPTDVLFLDLVMPDIEGSQILEIMHREGLEDVKVIMVTGQDPARDAQIGETLRIWNPGATVSQMIGAVNAMIGAIEPEYQSATTSIELLPPTPLV